MITYRQPVREARRASVRRVDLVFELLGEALIANRIEDAVFGGLNVSEESGLMRSIGSEFILARPVAEIEMEIHSVGHRFEGSRSQREIKFMEVAIQINAVRKAVVSKSFGRACFAEGNRVLFEAGKVVGMNPVAAVRAIEVDAAQAAVGRIDRGDNHVFGRGSKYADDAEIEQRVGHSSRLLRGNRGRLSKVRIGLNVKMIRPLRCLRGQQVKAALYGQYCSERAFQAFPGFHEGAHIMVCATYEVGISDQRGVRVPARKMADDEIAVACLERQEIIADHGKDVIVFIHLGENRIAPVGTEGSGFDGKRPIAHDGGPVSTGGEDAEQKNREQQRPQEGAGARALAWG